MKKYIFIVVTNIFFINVAHDRIDNVPYSKSIQQNNESQTLPISGRQDDLDVELNDTIQPISTIKDTVISDNLLLLKTFISLGRSLTDLDENGNNFLHIAVQSNAFHVAQFLVAWSKNHTIDFFISNKEGLTPFDYVTNPRMQAILERK